jgi:hypothetical protein
LSVAHYSLTIFVALYVARAIAYWPQIVSIYRDPGGASAVSLWTWIVFTATHVATVIYALAALEDLIVAAVFGVNAVSCAAIVMLTTYKRCRHHCPPVWKNIDAGLLPEPDCHSDRRERVALATAPGNARTRHLRPDFKALRLRRVRRTAWREFYCAKHQKIQRARCAREPKESAMDNILGALTFSVIVVA